VQHHVHDGRLRAGVVDGDVQKPSAGHLGLSVAERRSTVRIPEALVRPEQVRVGVQARMFAFATNPGTRAAGIPSFARAWPSAWRFVGVRREPSSR